MTGERGSWRTVTEAIAAVQLRPFLSLFCCAKTDHIASGGEGATFTNAQTHWAGLKDAKKKNNNTKTICRMLLTPDSGDMLRHRLPIIDISPLYFSPICQRRLC